MAALIGLYIIGIGLSCLMCRKYKNLKSIIFYDCLIFDREVHKADDYFMKMINIDDYEKYNNNNNVNNLPKIENKNQEEENTSRELKSNEEPKNEVTETKEN